MRTHTAVTTVLLALAAGVPARADLAVGGLLDGLDVPGNPPERFVSRPRVQELTGRLIVRPVQQEAHRAAGLNADQAAARHAEAVARLAGSLVQVFPEVDEYLVKVPAGLTENQASAALMSTGLYEYAEPDWLCWPVKIPNDPGYANQWQLPKIQAPAAWDITVGTNLIIAITDSGLTHPDFDTVPGWNIPSNNNNTADVNGHGTFCAGMAGAKGNNGVGVVGAGWNFRIMPVRVTNNANGSATLANILAGGRWGVDNGAKCISASYSGVTNASVQTTGKYIKDKGGLYFYAAGNDGTKINGSDWADVVIVGATNSNDAKPSWSNYGALIDVVAPGVNVYSTVRPNSYGAGSGTSFSTPLAAGVAGMIWSANPALTPAQAETILFQSAKDLGSPGQDDTYGYGRVDLLNAVVMAGNASGISVPFLEQFTTANFDASVWTDISNAMISNLGVNPPSAPYSLTMQGNGSIATWKFNIQFGDPPLELTWWTQHQFVEQGKSLKVEYFKTLNGAWQTVKSIVSDGTNQTQFVKHSFKIPADGYGTDFRLRFTGVGGDGADAWFVDDIAIGPPGAECPPDLNGDGVLDLFDFLAFTNFFNGKDPKGDWNGDGVYDLFDFLSYVTDFNGGC